MSVWNFIIPSALSVGSEVIRTLWYLGCLFVIINMFVYATCQVIDKIFDRQIDLYKFYQRIEEADEAASQQPPLHIV